MKHLKTYNEAKNLDTGSLSEEFYNLFIDYAEKYDIEWVPEGGRFGWDDERISQFQIAEDKKCVVLDIKFKRGYGLARELTTIPFSGGEGVSEEFHNDMLEFADKIEVFTGYKPTIKHEWNNRDYKETRLYQIAISK